MMTLYNIPISGNCHKVRLLLSFLELSYQIHDMDLANSEQRSDSFLLKNPFAQVPVLDDDGIIIRDSQAILIYLAKKYGGETWWPDDANTLAEINAWLSTAANEITHGPARLRVHYKFGRAIDVAQAEETSDKVLTIINHHLADKNWLVNNKPSIADIAIYPYLALAHEGKLDIAPFKNILDWFSRFESLPNYISMPGINK